MKKLLTDESVVMSKEGETGMVENVADQQIRGNEQAEEDGRRLYGLRLKMLLTDKSMAVSYWI